MDSGDRARKCQDDKKRFACDRNLQMAFQEITEEEGREIVANQRLKELIAWDYEAWREDPEWFNEFYNKEQLSNISESKKKWLRSELWGNFNKKKKGIEGKISLPSLIKNLSK